MRKKLSLVAIFLCLPFSLVFAQVPQIPSFTLSSQSVRQGDVLVVTLSPYSRTPRAAIKIFGTNFAPDNFGKIYIGIDPEAKLGKYIAYLVDSGTNIRVDWYYKEVEVLDRQFQEIRVRTRKPVRNIPQRMYEINAINKAYKLGNLYQSYTDSSYVQPLDSVVQTKEFYRKVVFSNGVNVHNGVDLRAAVLMPVKAINSGKVVLTGFRFSLEGNMVILDHGSGIFSLYLHLSRVDVNEGQFVKGGETIGLVGDTGLGVTGPHLHLAIKVRGVNVFKPKRKFVNVDPLEFIKTMNENLNR